MLAAFVKPANPPRNFHPPTFPAAILRYNSATHVSNLWTRVGPYEVISAAGAGGMGEVYRARDTRLNREVAIKVLARGVCP